ncbi:hypothetical protein IFVP182_C2120247 [Vibrio parahaemolyticus]
MMCSVSYLGTISVNKTNKCAWLPCAANGLNDETEPDYHYFTACVGKCHRRA